MSETAALIADNLEIWTGAVEHKSSSGRGSSKKVELYGIGRLRSLILDLAVTGKLVPKDPNDEPASKLLARLAKPKSEIVKADKFKSLDRDDRRAMTKEEFRVPTGWAWCILDDIAAIARGGSPRPIKSFVTSDENGIPWIKIGDSKRGHPYIEETAERIRPDGLAKSRAVIPGDLILSNSMSFGFPYIMKISGAIHDGWLVIRSPENYINKRFLQQLFLSPFAKKMFSAAASGAVVQNLNADKVRLLPVPLPPLAEQERIVAKVDELMALCDALEQESEDALAAHQTLVETLLATLVNSTDAADLTKNWARLEKHFDTLFTTEASIDALEQTVVALAVKGGFSPANRSPDAEMLETLIAKEKGERIAQGQRKKQKDLSTDQAFDDLRTSYSSKFCVVRIDDVAEVVRGGSPRPAGDARFYGGEIPFLKVADVTNIKGKAVEGYSHTITQAGLARTRYISERVVLLSNSGATLGKAAILEFPASFNDGIAAFLALSDYVYDEFLHLCLNHLSAWFLKIAARGQGQPNLNTDIIRSVWIPIPGLTEQKRIVAKVDELRALCNELKSSLADAAETQRHLADAIVERAAA